MVVRRNLFIDKLSSPTLHVIGLYPGSGLVPRKTVIGINIATSASRSIGNLRWLLDRESVAAICGQASFIVKVERRGFYIHQEIAPGAGAWLVVCHTTLLP